MGTVCELSVLAPTPAVAERALQEGLHTLQDAESKLSDYDPQSELSTLSRDGFSRVVPLSERTREALSLSLDHAARSGGAFDPTVGPLVDLWRAAKTSQRLPSEDEIRAAKARVDYRALVLSPEGGRLLLPGMRLDLGGIAKGLAMDWAIDAMRAAGATGGRINFGGQVSLFGDTPPALARVALPDPLHPAQTAWTLTLKSGESIGTTADYERGLDIAGTRVSHVFDPRTGLPVEQLLAVVVVAPRGVDADALSKPLFVLGEALGLPLVRAAGAEALWVRRDGTMSHTEGLAQRVATQRRTSTLSPPQDAAHATLPRAFR